MSPEEVRKILDNLVEVELPDSDSFLKIKETLTRIGVAHRKENTIYQSCHILFKKGCYYITHFKEMYMLDGRETTFDDEDLARRNTIVNLLHDWGLLSIKNREKTKSPLIPMNKIKVINFKDKQFWTLKPKYNIGKRKSH